MSLEEVFKECSNQFFADLSSQEMCTFSLDAEKSNFVRFNNAKVRQATFVEQGILQVQFIKDEKSVSVRIPFTEDIQSNQEIWQKTLQAIRKRSQSLPDDPFLIRPKNNGTSHEVYKGQLLPQDNIINAILEPANTTAGGADMAGIYAGGSVFRGNANSEGQSHWFESNSFLVDYSFYDKEQNAVKGSYAGFDWNKSDYEDRLKETNQMLELMNRPRKEVPCGKYRTYLAPGALHDLLRMLSWGGVSRSAHERGQCPLSKLFTKEVSLSPLVNVYEDFSLGLNQRFNDLGEIAPEKTPIITNGKDLNLLASSRTAKEFNVSSNNASYSEGLRSPVLETGSLSKDEILKKIETGLFISNIHYLNWSDYLEARVTGMTRYACFWIEDGQIVAPIKDLRFDESYFRFWGENLIDFTDFSDLHPETLTYEQRDIGGAKCPGMLVDNFTFTL